MKTLTGAIRAAALTVFALLAWSTAHCAPQQIDSWLPEGAYGQVFPDSGDPLGIGCLTSGGGVCERVPAGSPTDWRYTLSGYAGYALCRAGLYYSVRTSNGAMSCDWFEGNGVCYEPTDEAPGTIVCYPVVLTPGVTLSPASLVFASQPLGSTSAAQTVTVYSSGNAPLHITSITASGDYQISGNTCPAALEIGQWCQFDVRFAPTATGTRTGFANVYHDAPGGLSTVSLTGTGVAAVPALSVSPASLAFGTRFYGSASTAQTVTLSNTGTAPLTFTSIATTSADFPLGASTCVASLAAGASCTVEVTFVARSVGAKTGQLAIASNAPSSPHTVALSGTGSASANGWGPFDDANAGGTGGDRVPVVNALVTARSAKRAQKVAVEMGIPLVVASALMEGNPGAETGSFEKDGVESDPDCNGPIKPPDPQCQDGECPGGCVDDGCTPGGGSGGSQAGSPDAGGGIGDFIDDAIDVIDGVISGIMEAAKELFGFLDNLIGQFAADPVNTATGALVEEHLDYVGAGRFRLAFSRTYNGAPFVSSTHRGVDVGPGWSINWDRSIVLSADKTTARVVRGDGKSYLFTKQPNGTWNGGADMLGKLTWRADRSGNPLDWTYTDAGENRELYSAAGKLQSVSGRGGVAYTLTYDGSGRLSRVQNASGRALVLAYGASGRLASMTDPAGAVTTYAYDPLGRLVSVTYPDGRVRGYRYEDARFAFSLTAIVDAAGTAVANFTYDDSNRVVAFSGPNGTNAMTFSYQQGSTAVTDASGTTRTRQVTQNLGKLQLQGLSATCAGCGTLGSGVGYDANGFLTSVIDRRGMETRYAYNSRGLPTSVTRATGRPEQRTTTIDWHATFRLPVTLAEPTRTTAFEYNAAGRLTAMTRTAGGQTRTWRYEYDAQGRLTRAVGPRTDVTQARSFSYDAAGNVATLTNEMGQVSTRGYDAHGRLVSSTDANGRTQSRTLDASGRILSTTGNGLTTTYAYNSRGRLASVTAPDGSTTTYIRDSGLRISGIDRGNGEHVRYTREARGLVTKVETFDAAGQLARVASTAYDAFGRVSQSISAEGRAVTYQYDSSGNVTQAADALGNVVTMGYDALNRPILVTDALNGQVSATYNSAGLTASVTDPRGLQTSYGYSGQGDPTSTASPDAGASSASFNAAGNVVTSTDARGKTTSYTYDALGRLTRASFADASAVTYTYDIAANGVGLLARVDDPSGSTAYTYDAQGRTATRTVTIDGVALATLFGRDSLGRVTSVTYPSGKVLSIAYADGRVSALHLDGAPLATSIAYFPFGGPESWVFGNGTQYLRAIDANGRIAAFTTPRGDKSLAFDAAGRITRIDRHVGETTDSQAFGYDTTGRLTSFAGYTSQAPLETQSFTYDANGNRLTATLNATTRAYSYVAGSNRLASVSGLYANTWDAAGNLLADGQRSFTYDARGRLASATMGALTTTYRHNARGQRVMKTNAQETVRYLHDEAGHLLGEYGPSGTPLREYVWLGDTPLAVLGREPAFCAEGASPPCEGVAYLWTDHLNSPREATNAANRRIWAWESLPFGESAPNESPEGLAPFTLNLRFPGQYFDRETGLHQNSQREYAPFVGQYTQTDPIGIAAGPNPLSYVNNTPLSRTDSLGLWACSSEQYADLYFDTFLGFNETLADEGLRSVLSIAGLGSALAAEVNGMTSMQALNYIVRQYVFSPRAFRGEMTISAAGRVFNAALARGMIISSLGPLATVEAGLAFGASIQAYQRCIQACFP